MTGNFFQRVLKQVQMFDMFQVRESTDFVRIESEDLQTDQMFVDVDGGYFADEVFCQVKFFEKGELLKSHLTERFQVVCCQYDFFNIL